MVHHRAWYYSNFVMEKWFGVFFFKDFRNTDEHKGVYLKCLKNVLSVLCLTVLSISQTTLPEDLNL